MSVDDWGYFIMEQFAWVNFVSMTILIAVVIGLVVTAYELHKQRQLNKKIIRMIEDVKWFTGIEKKR